MFLLLSFLPSGIKKFKKYKEKYNKLLYSYHSELTIYSWIYFLLVISLSCLVKKYYPDNICVHSPFTPHFLGNNAYLVGLKWDKRPKAPSQCLSHSRQLVHGSCYLFFSFHPYFSLCASPLETLVLENWQPSKTDFFLPQTLFPSRVYLQPPTQGIDGLHLGNPLKQNDWTKF